MSTVLFATVPGRPIPQGRGRTPPGASSRPYDPPRSKAWKRAAIRILREVAIRDEWARRVEGPIRFRLVAIYPRPRALKGDERAFHTAPGDADNLAKASMDAATATGRVWGDDRQVAVLESVKVYGRPGEAPRVEILIEALG